jgi:hypothetical protein
MTDLRVELEHRCVGEDDRVTIERHRERLPNLEGDYGTSVAAPIACATHTPISPRATEGGGGVGAWRLLHTSAWWFDHASFRPTW